MKQPTVTKDEDGDLVVEYINLRLEHRSTETNLEKVGLQIWKGGLFLADYLMNHQNIMQQADVVIDLGTGVGLTAIVAALAGAKKIFATDVDETCLQIAQRNINRNRYVLMSCT